MPNHITIPRLGWSMEEGIFGEWLKQPGDVVQAGDLLFLLEGEKAAHEVEAIDSGILAIPSDAPGPGEKVLVGQTIGFLLQQGETAPTSVGKPPVSPSAATPSGPVASHPVRDARSRPESGIVARGSGANEQRPAGPAARRMARQMGLDLASVPTPDPTGRILVEDVERAATLARRGSVAVIRSTISTPRARRRAAELGIDWKYVAGSGRNGRVRECDIVAAAASTGSPNDDRKSGGESQPVSPGTHTPASRLRSTLAQRMIAGLHQTAPVTITTKVDASNLVKWKNELRTASTVSPTPGMNDLILWLTAQTLRSLPQLNSCWFRNGIWQYSEINLSMAIDTENGLVAPAIMKADTLSLPDLAAATRALIDQARSGRLTQTQLQSGTFTVTNLGMFGVDAFTPILNLPQAGILGVGRIVTEPVVRDGTIVVGQTMTLSLTFDHRVIDGAPAARWLQTLSNHIANPPCDPS